MGFNCAGVSYIIEIVLKTIFFTELHFYAILNHWSIWWKNLYVICLFVSGESIKMQKWCNGLSDHLAAPSIEYSIPTWLFELHKLLFRFWVYFVSLVQMYIYVYSSLLSSLSDYYLLHENKARWQLSSKGNKISDITLDVKTANVGLWCFYIINIQ